MQSRRSFMQAIGAIGATFVFPISSLLLASTLRKRRDPIDVTGKPTPRDLICGVPGVAYFNCTSDDRSTRGDYAYANGLHWYLNGIPIDARASEIDTLAGWARMYDVKSGPDADGKYVIDFPQATPKFREEIRNSDGSWTIPITADIPAICERIHFGKVELR